MTPNEEAQIYQLRQEAFEININSSVDKACAVGYAIIQLYNVMP